MRKSIFLALIPFVLLTISGCGVKPVEKASFARVSTFLWDEEPTVTFSDVCFFEGQSSCNLKNVYTGLINLKIEIDESLSGTAVSVKPHWLDRYSKSYLAITTPNVVVYVQSKEDLNHWNAWRASEIDKLEKYLWFRRQPRKVLPEIKTG